MPARHTFTIAILLAVAATLASCGKAERELTTSVLATAHAVDAAVAILEGGDSRAFSLVNGGWDGVQAYRRGPEGRTVAAFLEQYRRPVVVPDGYRRAGEIRELSLVTAELASLALEPRGTWITYVQEMNGLRTRFNRALLALETGAKKDVLLNAKGEAGSRLGSLRIRIQSAEAKAEVDAAAARERERVESEESEKARQADLLARAAAEDESFRRRAAEASAKRGKALDEAFRRRATAGQTEPAPKLGGGTFPAPPK